MCKLALDHVRREAMLIKDGAGAGAKTVAGGAGVIAHAIQGVKHGVFTHKGYWPVCVREKMRTVSRVLLQFPQYRYGLSAKRHNMRVFHFHARGRDTPLSLVKIHFLPLCGA